MSAARRRRAAWTTAVLLLGYLLLLPWISPDLFPGVRTALAEALSGSVTSPGTATEPMRTTVTTRPSTTTTSRPAQGTAISGGTTAEVARPGGPGTVTPTEPGAPVGTGAPSCLANNSEDKAPCANPLTLGPVDDIAIGAADVAPGDRIERALDLTSHTPVMRTITLTTRDAQGSPLTSDRTYGLQLHVDRCPVPWTPTVLADGGRTYTCASGPGAVRTVLAPVQDGLPRRGSILTGAVLSGLTVTGRVTTDHLRLTLRLPDDAPLELAGHSTSLTYTFTGTS